jgi:hypothetical protein
MSRKGRQGACPPCLFLEPKVAERVPFLKGVTMNRLITAIALFALSLGFALPLNAAAHSRTYEPQLL